MIEYYQETGILSIDSMKQKIEIIQKMTTKDKKGQRSKIVYKNPMLTLKKSQYCLVCEQPRDRQILDQLNAHIKMLEELIGELES